MSLVILAVVMSVICLHTIAGVREGTLAAAIFVGLINRKLNPLFEKLEKKLLCSR